VRALTFSSPYLLPLLLIVPPVGFLAWWLQRKPTRYAVAFTNLDVLASVAGGKRRVRALIPLVLFLLALTVGTAAIARPRATVNETAERATVVLLVDVSLSMRASDVKPTRLLAAARAMSLFAARLPKKVRVGLISFSDGPTVLVSPTTDRALLQEGIDLLEPEGDTAIGDGLGMAVQVLTSALWNDVRKTKDGKIPGAIILLSDGAQTDGTMTPLQGARRAKRAGIRVFTVGLGTNHGRIGPAVLSAPSSMIRPDPVTLSAIARETDGETFRAQSAERVEHIYRQLGRSIATKPARREVTSWFAGVAALLLLASMGAAQATRERLP